ncbi:MAG TPA: OsmC family protein, partial [Solirubrobacteraceae bacterium]|nr:OsmC family protein [Solirubrobacteraceae bacterium]
MAERLEVTAAWRGGYATDVRARGHEIRVDEPGWGGDTGMMPTELFCASMASCFCLAVAHVAGKRGIATPGLEVTVEAERAGTELRYGRMTVTATAAMEPAVLDELVGRAVRFCWVSNTLAEGVDVEYRSTAMNAD